MLSLSLDAQALSKRNERVLIRRRRLLLRIRGRVRCINPRRHQPLMRRQHMLRRRPHQLQMDVCPLLLRSLLILCGLLLAELINTLQLISLRLRRILTRRIDLTTRLLRRRSRGLRLLLSSLRRAVRLLRRRNRRLIEANVQLRSIRLARAPVRRARRLSSDVLTELATAAEGGSRRPSRRLLLKLLVSRLLRRLRDACNRSEGRRRLLPRRREVLPPAPSSALLFWEVGNEVEPTATPNDELRVGADTTIGSTLSAGDGAGEGSSPPPPLFGVLRPSFAFNRAL